MEEQDIRKYAELMKELGLTGFELSENGNTVRLERVNSAKDVAIANLAPGNIIAEDCPDLINICSPMVGVFYSSNAESAAPFVQVGDKVHKGDVLGLIEAMKLINEIIAEQSGTIAEICVENKNVVDFGHVLFKLRKEHE